MADGPKYPLSWRQRRTPTRKQKRSKRWQKVFPGLHFKGTSWVVTEGPWRKVKRSGSVSWVTVRCDEKYGGCGAELSRKLDNLIQGKSTGCIHCHQRRLKQRQSQDQEPR